MLRAAIVAASLLLCCSAHAAHTVIDIVDKNHLRFRWEPASGPVDGYVVFVSTNGGDRIPRAYVTDVTEVRIDSQYGDTISVTVAASGVFNGSIVSGPQSDPSDTYRFVESSPVDHPPGGDELNVRYDFDGDGRADILVINQAGQVRLWTMNGLSRVDDQLLYVSPGISAVAVGDFDGDGTEDTLWLAPNGSLFALLGLSIASYQPDTYFEVVSSGDFNADGRTDLIFRRPESLKLQTWLLDGANNPTVVTTAGSLDWFIGSSSDWTLRGSGDFDGDWIDDLVWVHVSGAVAISFMQDGQIVEEALIGASLPGVVVIAIGDLDGDGRSDLVVRENGGLVVWLMDGVSVIEAAPIRPNSRWPVIGSRDLDGDGRDDLVLAGSGGKVGALLMNGTVIVDQGTIESDASGFLVIQSK